MNRDRNPEGAWRFWRGLVRAVAAVGIAASLGASVLLPMRTKVVLRTSGGGSCIADVEFDVPKTLAVGKSSLGEVVASYVPFNAVLKTSPRGAGWLTVEKLMLFNGPAAIFCETLRTFRPEYVTYLGGLERVRVRDWPIDLGRRALAALTSLVLTFVATLWPLSVYHQLRATSEHARGGNRSGV